MLALNSIDDLKVVLRESEIPFFDDAELQWYVDKFNGNYNRAVYELLIVKSENTGMSISGMSAEDSSSYFRRLANRYRPNNSGVLK